MRRTGRRSQQETKQQLIRPSHESEKIDAALSVMATRVRGVLTERMVEMWHRDLDVYPTDAIEWALDTYGRNAKRLPALADITELLATWQGAGVSQHGCEPECKDRHGKGYSGNDCILLFKKVIATGGKFNESMFDELDKTRGLVPEWRRA